MSAVTLEIVRERLVYEPDSGDFFWRTKPCKNKSAGDPAGCSSCNGYKRIALFGRLYMAHRLAWLHFYGRWPDHHIDHINGDRLDNRIANLRDVSRSTNMQNQRRATRQNLSSGLLGVSSCRGRHRAMLWVNGRQKYLGTYQSPQLAHEAYLAAKRELHAGCAI